jgi:hypothetical protein
LRLSSLATCFVLAQDKPNAWAWVRGQDGFPPERVELTGPDNLIVIPALRIDLPLSEIYAGT